MRRAQARIGTIAVAIVATVVVWLVGSALVDGDLTAKTSPDGTAQEVTLPAVVLVTLLAGLAGWALLALLERFTSAPRTIWVTVALVVLLISLLGPTGGVGTGAKVALACLHLTAAAVIVPLFARTVANR